MSTDEQLLRAIGMYSFSIERRFGARISWGIAQTFTLPQQGPSGLCTRQCVPSIIRREDFVLPLRCCSYETATSSSNHNGPLWGATNVYWSQWIFRKSTTLPMQITLSGWEEIIGLIVFNFVVVVEVVRCWLAMKGMKTQWCWGHVLDSPSAETHH